jgi:hypothetical protein
MLLKNEVICVNSGSFLLQQNLCNLHIFAVCEGVRAKLHSYPEGIFAISHFLLCLQVELEVTYFLLEVTYILLTHVSNMAPFWLSATSSTVGSSIVLVLLLLTSVIVTAINHVLMPCSFVFTLHSKVNHNTAHIIISSTRSPLFVLLVIKVSG